MICRFPNVPAMTIESIFSPAQLVGYLALIIGVTAFLQKNDRRLTLLVAMVSLAYIVHFALLGNWTASGSSVVSCVRNLIALKTRAKVWVAVFIATNVAIGVWSAESAAQWIPVAASCLATVAVFRMSGIPMRLVLLTCTMLWVTNNILSGSIGGTVLECFIATANLTTIIRLARARQRAAAGTAPAGLPHEEETRRR